MVFPKWLFVVVSRGENFFLPSKWLLFIDFTTQSVGSVLHTHYNSTREIKILSEMFLQGKEFMLPPCMHGQRLESYNCLQIHSKIFRQQEATPERRWFGVFHLFKMAGVASQGRYCAR